MHFPTLLAALVASASPSWASYVLKDDYFQGGSFFDRFSFWTTSDPTHGFVSYQSYSAALSQKLISNTSTNIHMGVDSTNITPNGRPSVRLTSNKAYNEALVILDLQHMPGGICGTWPAFWMVGPNWPNEGEIDIIEGVHEQTGNDMTLHTGPSCSISNTNGFSGTMGSTDCTSSGSNNQGCGISSSNTQTYGAGFNSINGGVYATEWTTVGIKVWFFPRSSIPSDITSGKPTPSGWGTPLAYFGGNKCNYGTSFENMQLVFDTTFCGDWAGAVWSSSSCASKASSCNAYVQNNPSAFANAYWSVNALKVYQQSASGSALVAGSPVTSSATPTTFATSSSTFIPASTETDAGKVHAPSAVSISSLSSSSTFVSSSSLVVVSSSAPSSSLMTTDSTSLTPAPSSTNPAPVPSSSAPSASESSTSSSSITPPPSSSSSSISSLAPSPPSPTQDSTTWDAVVDSSGIIDEFPERRRRSPDDSPAPVTPVSDSLKARAKRERHIKRHAHGHAHAHA